MNPRKARVFPVLTDTPNPCIQRGTLYALLGVDPSASEAEILDAYTELTADIGSDPEALIAFALGGPDEHVRLQRRLLEAVTVLTHRERRRRYDEDLGLNPAAVPAEAPADDAGAWLAEVPPLPIDGEYLRCARLARGLSLEQLSQRTRVQRHHLENLEAGRGDQLPARVYLRGILRCVAHELGLDPEATFLDYTRSCLPAQEPPPAPVDAERGDGLLLGPR